MIIKKLQNIVVYKTSDVQVISIQVYNVQVNITIEKHSVNRLHYLAEITSHEFIQIFPYSENNKL